MQHCTRPIEPLKLQTLYPRAWAYLTAHRADLIDRDVAPPPPAGVFYAYGRHQALETVFVQPKIIYSVNQRGDKYGYDSVGVAVASGGTAGEVMMLNPKHGYSLEFILGLLNQRAVEFFLRKRGSPFRGGYYSRGSAVMGEVPVPKLDLINNATDIAMHQAITAEVHRAMQLQRTMAVSSGRALVLAKRQYEAALKSLEQLFDQLWGFSGQVQKITLPGE